MSGPAGRQNLMVADEMFPDGPGAGVDFADVEDVVRDVGGPAGLLNDLTEEDKLLSDKEIHLGPCRKLKKTTSGGHGPSPF